MIPAKHGPAQALCCECGQLREYRRAANPLHEWPNFEDSFERLLGDLKCKHCARITRHALLRHPDDKYRNRGEYIAWIARECSGPEPSDAREHLYPGVDANKRLTQAWNTALAEGLVEIERARKKTDTP
ncbi:MAG: hypothetical protein QM662_02430 [Gordonia sp. (in: high G+C Gram-positive bacteria)]